MYFNTDLCVHYINSTQVPGKGPTIKVSLINIPAGYQLMKAVAKQTAGNFAPRTHRRPKAGSISRYRDPEPRSLVVSVQFKCALFTLNFFVEKNRCSV